MKKYTVTSEFIETQHDGRYYPEGSEYESVDKERVKYLQERGFLGVEVPATKKEDGKVADDSKQSKAVPPVAAE
ncbi:hypothetical protein [Paenibacillus sp. MBLB4367]|uniref:hypothetical protein n=1 Tax=Paenibacillus sp. MBLB4367 TaxID=3384767 RepID=UPI00390839A9